MLVLVVEDDPNFVVELSETIRALPGDPLLVVARSRESAEQQLRTAFFDLVVLDLRIPTTDGAMDADVRHGHAVFALSRALAPGTPIRVLTGSPAEDFIPDLLASQQQMDIWGEQRKVGTIDFLQKYRFDEFPGRLAPIASSVQALDDIELERSDFVGSSVAEDRLLRIFVRRRGGVRGSIWELGGGLSGAKVLRIRVTDATGVLRDHAVGKIGSHEEVLLESQRFDMHVSRLEPQATPRRLETIEFGAGNRAGVFYGLAAGFGSTLFDCARINEGRVGAAIQSAARITNTWRASVGETRMTVRDVRRRLLSDDDFVRLSKEFNLSWALEFEARQVQVRWCCIHGDLHGGNVLVDDEGHAILIDYGDVGEGPASLDPVTLELSGVFHPQGPFANTSWPSAAQAENWVDMDAYVSTCSCPEYVRESRAWAQEAAAGRRELAASMYAYLLRQLKYSDTRKDLILNFLAGVDTLIKST